MRIGYYIREMTTYLQLDDRKPVRLKSIIFKIKVAEPHAERSTEVLAHIPYFRRPGHTDTVC